MTLTFDLLTSVSIHTERLLYSICVASLVVIAQAVFFQGADKQTDKPTDATERPTHAGGYTAGVGEAVVV